MILKNNYVLNFALTCFFVEMVQWEETLRKYFWEPTPGVPEKPPWNDGEIVVTKPKVEDPTTDRIGRADRDNPKFDYSKIGGHTQKKNKMIGVIGNGFVSRWLLPLKKRSRTIQILPDYQ